MKLLDAENRGKMVAVAALVLFGVAAMWNNSQQNAEAAKKVCVVCGVQKDVRPKTVFAWVPFNNEEFPVDSQAHKDEFLKRPAYYSEALHRMGLHDH